MNELHTVAVGNSFDEAAAKTAIGFYELLFKFHRIKQEHCIPAIVKSYNRTTGIAVVRPLVKYIYDTVGGASGTLRPEYALPVRRICHGGFVVDIPLFAGDTGWIIAGDRHAMMAMRRNANMILANQEFSKDDKGIGDGANEGPMMPDDRATTDYAWGFFIPDYWGNENVEGRDGIVVKYTPSKDATGGGFEIVANEQSISLARVTTDGSKRDVISLDDDGLHYSGTPDETRTVLSDLRFDTFSHQLQKKTFEQMKRGDLVVGESVISDWTLVEGGQAVPID